MTTDTRSSSYAAPTARSGFRSSVAFGIFLLLAFSAAAFGALFAPDAWYAGLNKPSWNPPNWIFGPVWTTLYALMAYAAWRVWKAGDSQLALGMWVLQLIPNALWSYFFFGVKRIEWALVDIVLLLISIVACTALFAQRDRLAATLMLPYIAWVSFATFLNWTLLNLNWQI
jgi:translocator protein